MLFIFTSITAGALDAHAKDSSEWKKKHDALHQQHQVLAAEHAKASVSGGERASIHQNELEALEKVGGCMS